MKIVAIVVGAISSKSFLVNMTIDSVCKYWFLRRLFFRFFGSVRQTIWLPASFWVHVNISHRVVSYEPIVVL